MARAIHKLAPERVRNRARVLGVYADVGGLFLCVTPWHTPHVNMPAFRQVEVHSK